MDIVKLLEDKHTLLDYIKRYLYGKAKPLENQKTLTAPLVFSLSIAIPILLTHLLIKPPEESFTNFVIAPCIFYLVMIGLYISILITPPQPL